MILGTLIAVGGPEVIKCTNRFLVTALLGVGAIIVVLCFVAVPVSEIVAVQPVLPEAKMLFHSSPYRQRTDINHRNYYQYSVTHFWHTTFYNHKVDLMPYWGDYYIGWQA